MKRAVAAAVVVVAALLVWLWPSDEVAAPPHPTSTGTHDDGDNAPTPARARPPTAAASREPLRARPAVAPRPSGPSLIEQLVAIHAITSQAEVSAYLERNAAKAVEQIDQFCDAAAALPRGPLFPESPRLQDAAPYLGPLVDWVAPARRGSLDLPEDIALRADADGVDWLDTITPSDLGRVDVSWMRALTAFDHWSLAAREPGPGEPYDAVIELPSYLQLRRWARLRLAVALAVGDFTQASAEVRQLAALIDDQGFALAVQYAAMLLESERAAYDVAAARGLDVTGWTPDTAEALAQRRRLDRVAYAFLYPGVDPAISHRALACAPSPCAALVEAAWVHATLGEYASRSTTDDFWATPAGRCSPSALRQIRTVTPRPPEEAKAMLDDRDPLDAPL